MKSSATRVFGKTFLASSRIVVGSSYRGLRCVRTSRPTAAAFATSAACRDDECPDRLACLQLPEARPCRDAERLAALDAEPPGSRSLFEPIAQARDRVDRLVGRDRVLAAVHGPARRDLLRLHREAWREVAEGEQLADEPLDAPRAVDLEGRPASVHRHALDHAGQPEEMVSVEVGQEDPRHLHEAQAALHELPLRPFPAVEQNDLRPSFHRDRAHVPLRRRPRSGRAEEHDLHGRVSRGAAGAYRLWSPRETVYRRRGMPRRSSMRSIDGRSLDLDDVVAVARGRDPVRLAPAAAKRVDASRRALEKVVAKGTLAYGIKTGFGELANVAISDADVRALQLNLLRSHAIGLGPPLRRDEVRAALLLRANTLAMGYSGVRRILVTRLLDFLNRGVHPVIPSRRSLGASGDLAPLAPMGLVLVGEGEAEVEGRVLPGAKALDKAKLSPLNLQSEEGLAIINGTSVMAAVGAILVNDGVRLLKGAQGAASMSFQALPGAPK